MKRTAFILLAAVLMLLPLLSPGAADDPVADSTERMGEETMESHTIILTIDGAAVAVEWEENEAVAALAALLKDSPLTVNLSMYGGFEQVGPLGVSLPRQDQQITTVSGDVVLYSGNQIVIFYGSNAWAYTRLGHITDQTQAEMRALLGRHDAVITLSIE